MTTKLPSLDFMNDTLKPNTIELTKKEIKEIIVKPKIENKDLKEHLKESLLPKKELKRERNKRYYNKNKTKILAHKSNQFKTRAKTTKELENKFTMFLNNILEYPHLPGTYNIKLKDKKYNFTCKIIITKSK